ncbi:hypothetical protein Tco_1282323 [Tanacetum coccineum]
MKRVGKGFSRVVTPLFPTMMVQAQEEMGEGSDMSTDPHHTPIITQPSTSQPYKKQKPRKSKKQNNEVPQLSDSTDDVADENVPTHSNNPLLNGEDRLKLNELIELCTKLSDRVLDLEHTKTTQALKIESLKRKVKKLKKKKRSRTHVLKRLRKVGRSTRIESSKDEGLGDQEDASKQGRKIDDIDKGAKVTLIDETQGRFSEDLMFNTCVFDVEGVSAGQDMAEMEVSTADLVTTTGKLVTTADVAISAASTILVSATTTTTTTTATTTATTTIADEVEMTLAQTLIEIKTIKPKAKGIVMQEPSESTLKISSQQPSQVKGQGSKDKDYEIATRLQAEEQGELTVEEKSKLFVELMDKTKNHFARLRVEEQRRKPPTKAQNRNQMCTYLKNMAGFTHNQLKNKSFDEVQKAFDNTMNWIDTFVRMDSEVVKGSKDKAEGNDDQEEAEMRKLIEIISDEEEVAIDAIPLATKPPSIVD